MAEPTAPEHRPIAEISHGPSAFEGFLEKNQKLLLLVGILLALGTAAWVVMKGIREGADQSAGEALVGAKSAADYEAVMTAYPGSSAAASAALLLADFQWTEGRQDAALATLRAVIASQPDHPAAAAARARLASHLARQGKADEARTEFETLLANPQAAYLAPYALVSLGEIAKAAGDKDQAKEYFTRAGEDYPDNPLSQLASQENRFLDFKMPEEIEPPAVEPEPEPATTPIPGTEGNPMFDALKADPTPAEESAPTPPPLPETSQDDNPPEQGE